MSQFTLLEDPIAKIRENVLMMGSLADRNLAFAMRALADRDDKAADYVEAEDSELDHLEKVVDESVVVFLARHRPVAQDLRLALMATKIAGNLERIGDLSVSISRIARNLNGEPYFVPLQDFQQMANLALTMLREALKSFVSSSCETLRELIASDKAVDAMNKEIFARIAEKISNNPDRVTAGIQLILVARNLERIADHAKDIAHEVYFLAKAEDIRHGQNTLGEQI